MVSGDGPELPSPCAVLDVAPYILDGLASDVAHRAPSTTAQAVSQGRAGSNPQWCTCGAKSAGTQAARALEAQQLRGCIRKPECPSKNVPQGWGHHKEYPPIKCVVQLLEQDLCCLDPKLYCQWKHANSAQKSYRHLTPTHERSHKSLRVHSSHQCAQDAGRGVKRDLQALRFNVCLVVFWTCMGPVTAFFWMISLFSGWECLSNACTTTVPQKYIICF